MPVREFGGRDRYDTSLRLANNFAARPRRSRQSVPVAFVASGLTLRLTPCRLSGLAGFFDAPVLLTRRADTLHGGVADFIEDYGVGHRLPSGRQRCQFLTGWLEDIEALGQRAHGVPVLRALTATRPLLLQRAKLGGGAAWCGG